MANPSGAGKAGGAKSGGGHASNAALDDDADDMAASKRKMVNWGRFKAKKRPNQMIDYDKSPSPPRKIS